jgi:hypothetical protein
VRDLRRVSGLGSKFRTTPGTKIRGGITNCGILLSAAVSRDCAGPRSHPDRKVSLRRSQVGRGCAESGVYRLHRLQVGCGWLPRRQPGGTAGHTGEAARKFATKIIFLSKFASKTIFLFKSTSNIIFLSKFASNTIFLYFCPSLLPRLYFYPILHPRLYFYILIQVYM